MGGLTVMQSLASTEHADKFGDPEWVGGLVAGVFASSVGILKGWDRWRSRKTDIGQVLVEQAAAVAEMAIGMQSPLRAELDAVRAQMMQSDERHRTEVDQLRSQIHAVERENAELRSEIVLLRSGQPLDRRRSG